MSARVLKHRAERLALAALDGLEARIEAKLRAGEGMDPTTADLVAVVVMTIPEVKEAFEALCAWKARVAADV